MVVLFYLAQKMKLLKGVHAVLSNSYTSVNGVLRVLRLFARFQDVENRMLLLFQNNYISRYAIWYSVRV